MLRKIRLFFSNIADVRDYQAIEEINNYKRVAEMLLSC